MKKHNHYIVVFALALLLQLAFINKGHAQTWNLIGNALTGTEKLGGSSGAFPLDFYINNSNKMSLTTAGNLDIKSATQGYMINEPWRYGNQAVPVYW